MIKNHIITQKGGLAVKQGIEINCVLKDFYDISGIRVSIHDTEFHEIYSYPAAPSRFCSCLQQNESVYSDCLKNDAAAFEKVRENGEVFVYRCKKGLYEAVAPVYHYGVLSGYLMMGQVRDDSEAALLFLQNTAFSVLQNREKAAEIAGSVRAIKRELIGSYISIMTVIAEYLTESNKLYTYSEKLPQMIREYINKNYGTKITLLILSQKFGCCNSTLTKCFKKEYKTSIMSYLCTVRLQKAEEMMKKTRKSLKEIAGDCGFYDQNYFSKAFTAEYGCSPSEYRSRR